MGSIFLNFRTARISGTLVLLSLSATTLLAQQDRIAGPVDRLRKVAIRGNVHPSANSQFDAGPVDPQMKLDHVMVMLKRSAAQQADLDQLLAEQQDRSSRNYHAWLTPEEFADRFGTSPNDIARVVSWLQSEGLVVDGVSRARSWVRFRGTAGQVQAALRTEVHRYSVAGVSHFANSIEPSVPAALEPLVMGIAGLDDFRATRAQAKRALPATAGPAGTIPQFTQSRNVHYLAPDDFATIYNLNPLYGAGYDGSGQRIVVAGESAVDPNDTRLFRASYGLPPNDPQILLVPGSSDPGFSDSELMLEANLDIQWAGAVARNATIIYVYSEDARISVFYAIDQNLAPIITLSFGLCEQQNSQALTAFMQSLAQQANAQGITWLAATLDSGAAACDAHTPPKILASQGLAASFPATLPEVTAVGGTQFDEGDGNYWAAVNSPSSASAQSYIPETAWNESGARGLAATGGGLSRVFMRPAWQSGPGVPNVNLRSIPDVALSAAGHDAYRVVSGGVDQPVAGTSAGTPAFAGILALVSHYQVLNGAESRAGLGNINPNLYRLAQTTPGVFHDITSGDNIVPCVARTPDCVAGTFGYTAGPGYDLVTGLGSVDGFNLAAGLTAQWSIPSIALVSPASAIAGAGPFTLAVNGSGFDAASVVLWSGTPLATTFVNGNELLASVSAGQVAAVGSASITVQGSRGTSPSVTFPINAPQALTLTDHLVTKTSPPSSGICSVPSSTPTVSVTDTVYVYFFATLTSSSLLSDDWLAPNGVVIPGDSWSPVTGKFCFPDSSLDLSTVNLNAIGTWQVRVYDHGSLLFAVPFTVTMPGMQTTVLAHAADGNKFKTTVLLTNASSVPAPYTLRFNDDQGALPSTRFELESGSLTGVIPGGGSVTIRTAGLGPATVNGWAELTAPASVGGSVIYSQKTNLPSIQEATAPIGTASSQHLFLQFDNTDKGSTGVALTNPGANPASNIQVVFRYSDGTTEVSSLPPLPSRNHRAFALSVPGKKGVAEITSNAPLLTVVFRANSTGALTALDAIPGSTDSTSITRPLAHVANGANFKTTVLLTNGGSSPAPYTLRFNDEDGKIPSSGFGLEQGTLTGTIPPGGSATIRTDGLGGSTAVGWAELTAPASVGGSVIFSQKVAQLPTLQEGTSTIVASGSSHFFAPFDNTAGAVTGVALTNPGVLAANVSVVIRYSDGTSETPAFPQIPSRNHKSFVLGSNLFPNTAGRSGVAEIVATSPLSVVEFRLNSTGAFTSFGTVGIPGQ